MRHASSLPAFSLVPFNTVVCLIRDARVVQFTGGTECDLTGVLRSTTVHLKCGGAQEVRDVLEDRTCHYRILAFSPLLCRWVHM